MTMENMFINLYYYNKNLEFSRLDISCSTSSTETAQYRIAF